MSETVSESAALSITKPTGLIGADFMRSTRGYVLPHGLDYREATKAEFWHGCMDRLKPGDRIEVHSHDRRIQFEIFVFESNNLGPMVRLDIGFKAIWPVDLGLPDPHECRGAYAMAPNGMGGWSVTAVGTAEMLGIVANELAARELIAALERRDLAAQREQEVEAAGQPTGKRVREHA